MFSCDRTNHFIYTLTRSLEHYAEIELFTTSSALPPPPMTGETVQYSRASEKQPCRQSPLEPVQGEVVSEITGSRGAGGEQCGAHLLGQQQTNEDIMILFLSVFRLSVPNVKYIHESAEYFKKTETELYYLRHCYYQHWLLSFTNTALNSYNYMYFYSLSDKENSVHLIMLQLRTAQS